MRKVKSLKNDRYEIILFERSSKPFVYLRDKEENSESLGLANISFEEVEKLWERQENSDCCLPCELLLHLDPKVVRAGNVVAELGLAVEFLEKTKKELGV